MLFTLYKIYIKRKIKGLRSLIAKSLNEKDFENYKNIICIAEEDNKKF